MILGLSLLLGPAVSASPAPGPDAPSEAAAQTWLDDAATLTVDPAPQTLLPGTLRVGDATLHIVGGQARAIWSGAAPGGAPARVVGAVFVGRATLHTPVPQPQALALANRLVGWLGAPRSVGDPLAAEGELRLEAVEGVILSPDVAAALQPDGGTDPEALAPLGPLFERRARLLRGELQAARTVGWDRFRLEHLGEPAASQRAWLDVHTRQPFGAIEPDLAPRRPAPDDGWLGLVHDPLQTLDGTTHTLAYTAGRDLLGRAALLPLWTEGAAAPLPTRLTSSAVRLGATAGARPETLDVELSATLEVTANQPTAAVVLRLPRVDPDAADPTLALDRPGRTLWLPSSGPSRWVALLPDAPLKTGATLSVQARWTDVWPARGALESTGPQRVLPGLVPDRIGSPAPLGLAVDLPAGWAALGADALHSEAPQPWPRVQLLEATPSVQAGAPTLRIALPDADAQRVAAQALPLLGGLEALLGTAAPDPLAIAPGPGGGRRGEPAAGMLTFDDALLRDLSGPQPPAAALHILAHELAHLTWGLRVRPASAPDRWLSESLAEVSAELVQAEARGAAWLQERQRLHREVSLRLPPVPLTSAWGGADARGALYHRGPAILLGPVRRATGDAALRAALRVLAEQPTVSTADLRAALEDASGVDLGAVFDAWVTSGQVPRVSARWEALERGAAGWEIRAQLTSNLPYGRLEVPVAATDRKGRILLEGVATLQDGAGELILGPIPARRVELVLDPREEVPVRPGQWERTR